MPDERRRHQLHQELGGLLTKDSVDELMSYLPPVGWADVATKADLGVLRGEIDVCRADLKGEMAEIRGEIAEVRGDMARLEGHLAEKLAGVKEATRTWAIGTMLLIVVGMAGMFVTVLVAKP